MKTMKTMITIAIIIINYLINLNKIQKKKPSFDLINLYFVIIDENREINSNLFIYLLE